MSSHSYGTWNGQESMAHTLTHGLAGALLDQTGFQQRYGPAATVALVVGRWGVVAVAGYIGLCLLSQMAARHLLARALGPQMVAVERLRALPLPG
jgi:hypothetical protein